MKDKLAEGTITEMEGYLPLARRLKLSGLYCGVFATLARDVPFSMMYFSLYGATKDALCRDSTEYLGIKAFAAGAIAGTVAAGATTPIDVIKTRVHSNAEPLPIDRFTLWTRKMRVIWFLVREVQLLKKHTRELLAKEGAASLFKGVVPRCLIISPLFGITMFCFEQFKLRFG